METSILKCGGSQQQSFALARSAAKTTRRGVLGFIERASEWESISRRPSVAPSNAQVVSSFLGLRSSWRPQKREFWPQNHDFWGSSVRSAPSSGLEPPTVPPLVGSMKVVTAWC